MPFKSSLARSAGKLLGVSRQRDLDLRGAAFTNWSPSYKGTATGGTITTPGNGYKYHFITANDQDFVVSGGDMQIDYIVIGGGGGGGSYYPGGYTSGGKGTNTVFTVSGGTPITAEGGGGGIKYNESIPYPAAHGGSGGGGNGTDARNTGNAGSTNLGGGGGGNGYPNPSGSLAGGSGIVIIRYKFQ